MSMDTPGIVDVRAEGPFDTKLRELGARAGDLLSTRGAFVMPVDGILSPHLSKPDDDEVPTPVLTSSGAEGTSWSALFGSAHLRRVTSESEGGQVDELVFMPRGMDDAALKGFVVAGWHSLTAVPTDAMQPSMANMPGGIEHLLYAINDVRDPLD